MQAFAFIKMRPYFIIIFFKDEWMEKKSKKVTIFVFFKILKTWYKTNVKLFLNVFTYWPLNVRILKNRKRIRKEDILKSLYRGFPRIVHAPIGQLITEYPERASSFENMTYIYIYIFIYQMCLLFFEYLQNKIKLFLFLSSQDQVIKSCYYDI